MKSFLVALLLSVLVGGSRANDCGTPPDVKNASCIVSGYSIGKWAYYACNEGYILYGRNRILCTGDGWTKPSLSCQMIKCGHPPPICNGTVTEGKEWPYGAEANYSCVEGYTLTGQETIHCTDAGAWSHPPPICTVIKCGHPLPICNGTVTEGKEWPYGAEASYSCVKGCNLTGQETIRCTDTGAWSHPPPKCTVIKCGHPPQICNGTVTEGEEWPYGAEASYSCVKGCNLTGQETIRCTDIGVWSHPPPKCAVIKCGHPPQICNGTVTEGEEWPYGAEASYSCVKGCNLTGQETIRCTDTGDWSHPPPKCTVIKCDHPPPICNGTVTEGEEWPYGTEASYSCVKGCNLTGQETIRCTDTGAWSHPPPKCAVIKCGHPPPISNGMVTEGEEWPYGTEANYSCVEGYTLTGQETIHCTDTGAWSHPPPNCTANECGSPPDVENANYTVSGYSIGNWAFYTCNKGYILYGRNSILCIGDGWTKPSFSCEMIKCGHPPPISSDMVTEDMERMFNNEDHPLTQETIHSTGIVAWSPPPPNANECGTPPDVENANYIVSGYSIGNWAFYTCNKGYILYGRNSILCIGDGWTKPSFSCETNDCGTPPDVENANYIVSGYSIGKWAFYTCNKGYILYGRNSILCIGDGWTKPSFSCEKKEDPLPISSDMMTEDMERMFNNEDHPLTQEIIHSTGIGAWSPPPPNANDCGTPPDVENANYIVSGYSIGKWAFYTCNKGYILHGRNRILCIGDGWTKPSFSCEMIKCGHPPPICNGTVTEGEEWPYRTEASYSCVKGCILTGQETIHCTDIGVWSHPPPKCAGTSAVHNAAIQKTEVTTRLGFLTVSVLVVTVLIIVIITVLISIVFIKRRTKHGSYRITLIDEETDTLK